MVLRALRFTTTAGCMNHITCIHEASRDAGRHLFGLTGRLHSVRRTMEMVAAEINFNDLCKSATYRFVTYRKLLAIVARTRDWYRIGPASEVRTGLRFGLRMAVLLQRPPAWPLAFLQALRQRALAADLGLLGQQQNT
jgi:hypothetical protein